MDNVKEVSECSEIRKYKRDRSVNFTQKETDLLVSLIEEKKHIIENKKSDATTWQDKDKAWKDIEKTFNTSSGSVYRDHKHLKLKYEAIKRDIRKKCVALRADRYKTGDSTSTTPMLTPVEQKVKDMILLSVEGNESCYHADFIMPSTSSSEILTENKNIRSASAQKFDDAHKNIEMVERDEDEPPEKKVFQMQQKEKQLHCEKSDPTSPHLNKWMEWNATTVKIKNHQVINKAKEKSPFDKLTEAKIEIALLQKIIITEELAQKQLQRKMLEDELNYKKALHELEIQHIRLKIELLKKDLENNDK